ncbi:MAG: hypothetical protein B7Y93_03930 [Micrococcales bacterium 32-70-13]|nr:MAG: hypothetical protein B7Y93_03930 [Micrococcales bacterium 32-70-13]
MSRRDQRDQGTLVYGGIPRAHLMPPEVALRRKDLARRRGLLVLTGAVVAATIAGIVASFLYAGAAEQRLADERRITDQLLATQLEYSEVVIIRGQLGAITDLRAQLSSVEVLWAESFTPYLSVFSPDEIVDSLDFIGNTPAEPVIGVQGPLRAPRVASATIVVRTVTLPNPQLWLRAWERIDTYADASIDSITLLQDGYETTVTINLNQTALAQRFGAEEETE